MAGVAAAVLYRSLNAPAAQVKASSKTRASQAPVGDHTKARVVLVTGGTGLVGKGIEAFIADCPEAKANESWVFLSSADGDLRDPVAVDAIFAKHRPTHVIHLAAKVGGLFANMAQKVEFYRENVLINDNVMECCRKFKVRCVWLTVVQPVAVQAAAD